MNRLMLYVMFVIIISLLGMTAYAFAGASEQMYACNYVDGSIMYTNKDTKGCHAVKMPELSIVPSYVDQHLGTPPKHVVNKNEPPYSDEYVEPVADRVCNLYREWMDIYDKTKGGFTNNDVATQQRLMVLSAMLGPNFSAGLCR